MSVRWRGFEKLGAFRLDGLGLRVADLLLVRSVASDTPRANGDTGGLVNRLAELVADFAVWRSCAVGHETDCSYPALQAWKHRHARGTEHRLKPTSLEDA